MFDPQDPVRGYELLWPRELFRYELDGILQHVALDKQRDALDWLLHEAMPGPHPFEDLDKVPQGAGVNPWEDTPIPPPTPDPVHDFGQQLLNLVDILPIHIPRQYYQERHRPPASSTPATVEDQDQLVDGWLSLMKELESDGYLDRRAGEECCDSDNDRAGRITDLVHNAIHVELKWPYSADDLRGLANRELLFSLIELFHDVVARPRTRWFHQFEWKYCGFEDFSDRTGQAIYRWKVNDLLQGSGFQLELADSGEDAGLLVSCVPDPRQQLVHTVSASAPATDRGRVDHAIALFRRRDATVEMKRDACRNLGDVLESRRNLLKEELLTKDEGALFQIANEFDNRHNRSNQHKDYDPAFRDWIFWWYLGTIELTNRMISRQDGSDD